MDVGTGLFIADERTGLNSDVGTVRNRHDNSAVLAWWNNMQNHGCSNSTYSAWYQGCFWLFKSSNFRVFGVIPLKSLPAWLHVYNQRQSFYTIILFQYTINKQVKTYIYIFPDRVILCRYIFPDRVILCSCHCLFPTAYSIVQSKAKAAKVRFIFLQSWHDWRGL